MRKTLLQYAQEWSPSAQDPFGSDKRKFLDYLIQHCNGFRNASSLDRIVPALSLSKTLNREMFQHAILVPLREEDDLFIGTSSRGVYLITSPEDAFTTISFYTNRIHAEKKHLRNLKRIALRNRLFAQFNANIPAHTHKTLYLDESGTPDISTARTDPYFIVCAVIADTRKTERLLAGKLDFLRAQLHKPAAFEFRSSHLSHKHYAFVLKELSTIDFEFAFACFVKAKLQGQGFSRPKIFYKYAFGFLIDDVLDETGEVNIIFDEYGGKNSKFQTEFFRYLRTRMLTFPVNKVSHMEMFSSDSNPFLQLADLLAGVVKNDLKRPKKLMHFVSDKLVSQQYFPLG
jgi:hypothetical protein